MRRLVRGCHEVDGVARRRKKEQFENGIVSAIRECPEEIWQECQYTATSSNTHENKQEKICNTPKYRVM